MSYVVVARKWRPLRFEDMAGQDHITRVLVNSIRAGRIAHAYLFSGIRGVGKTTAARILAKALNCARGPTPEPCNECDRCREISAGSSIDVYEIDGASNRGIDEVRGIIENVRYQPAKCRYKIYIIDEVHQVTKDAFNALLKTLEEPPPFAKFILATTEPHRVPETILSRCQRLDFRRISVREIVSRLREIADSEGLRISDGALVVIAREAEGSMRDAQSLLEQVLSYSGSAGETAGRSAEIDERLLADILGIAQRGILYDLSRAVIAGEPGACLEIVAKAASQGLDMPRLARDLVEHFRNLLVARLLFEPQGQTRETTPALANHLLDLPGNEIDELKEQARSLSIENLMDYFSVMAGADEALARSAYPRFALETALVRLATLPKVLPVTEALERLEQLEANLRQSAGGAARPAAEEPKASARSAAPDASLAQPVAAPGSDERDRWKRFVAFVMKEKKFLGSYLERVQPLELSPTELKIAVEDRRYLGYLRDAENLNALREFARRFFSPQIAVSISAGMALQGAGEGGAGAKQPDPLRHMTEEVVRVLGGSVKEVKRNI
ncbi:MAG TPA: DNA polymerase III subunit gamma/tau [Candidatus Acidoferrales bacterium]|nr:DNA polymerase III subunit gamma/tau [Candidatus Acidoferrales bacterium]